MHTLQLFSNFLDCCLCSRVLLYSQINIISGHLNQFFLKLDHVDRSFSVCHMEMILVDRKYFRSFMLLSTIEICEILHHWYIALLLLLNFCRNDGLLAFVNNFLKEHFLPAIFVDYRKCVQQAISSKSSSFKQFIATVTNHFIYCYVAF
jgi:hypothetical protein